MTKISRLMIAALFLLVLGSTVVIVAKFDWERFQCDPDRMKKLESTRISSLASTLSVDWPQWRGCNRDGFSAETGLRSEWSKDGPPVLWRRTIGRGFSSLAVAKGCIYTMAEEANEKQKGPSDPDSVCELVLCFDADTGRELWRFAYEPIPGAIRLGSAIHAGHRWQLRLHCRPHGNLPLFARRHRGKNVAARSAPGICSGYAALWSILFSLSGRRTGVRHAGRNKGK